MACIGMAYILMAYLVMTYIVMAYIVMAYLVMAYIAMAYVVVAYIIRTCTWVCRISEMLRRGRGKTPHSTAPWAYLYIVMA